MCSSAAVAASWRYGENFLWVADARPGGFLDALYVVAQVAQALAVLEMLTAVMAFLADEAANLFIEHRVVDAVAELAHRIDEESLTVGKQHRHGIEQMGLEGVATVPVARQRVGQIEIHMLGTNLQSFRCSAGHENSIALFDWFPLWASCTAGHRFVTAKVTAISGQCVFPAESWGSSRAASMDPLS